MTSAKVLSSSIDHMYHRHEGWRAGKGAEGEQKESRKDYGLAAERTEHCSVVVTATCRLNVSIPISLMQENVRM
jgi:hypothetical protein